ncbi:alpha/beta hydrolase fold domain-containing protein [Duganella sp. FT50W]|uniref:Alpha/beta hydrolase fold domain-containing protein n=1 Tax=Duganella lactea TaxID=2692173 RepID=A0A6L8MSG4_9BURK|nr:alpha/beta hydrolase [Duganella lactea]MYM84997.1 alpha/beta hydrolase fold domain-containing protein [Duganella lactea]
MATILVSAAVTAQTWTGNGLIIPLYPEGAIASIGVPEIREIPDKTGDIMIRNVSQPTLELFSPAPGHANGTAMIIAPGGGFVGLGYDAGGTAVARRLVKLGVTAFVLKYRTIRSAPDLMQIPEVHMKEMHTVMARAKSGTPVELPRFAGEQHAEEDGARAMRIVRQRASEWGISPKRVGFAGFSAGAFLAVDLAIGDKTSRPDFVVLLYGGLRTPVPTDAPPAFIAAAADDEYQPNDALQLYAAWRQAGVAAELHIYERGGHGFDLRAKGTTSDHWFDQLAWWMQSRGLIDGTDH